MPFIKGSFQKWFVTVTGLGPTLVKDNTKTSLSSKSMREDGKSPRVNADFILINLSRTDSQSANPVIKIVPIADSQFAKLLMHSQVVQTE